MNQLFHRQSSKLLVCLSILLLLPMNANGHPSCGLRSLSDNPLSCIESNFLEVFY